MLKVAVLDDYQNVTKKYGNWSELENKISLKIFNKYIQNKQLIKQLYPFDILCLMRERTKLGPEIISKLPNLKLVVTSGNWNPSVDNNSLIQRNIIFCGTDNSIQSTAELTWLLIMLVWRNILVELENMKKGRWQSTVGKTLFGKTLGIFGLGKQGKQVANFGKVFGMKVIAWSHNLTKESCKLENVELVSSEELFKNSDILSIHTKLSNRTRNFVNIDRIKLMKKSSIIINTSRGPIINEGDLIFAIKNRIISGVGLDVFDVEPLPKKHELRQLISNFNIVLTPHLGYVSSETYEKFHNGYVLAIKAYIQGNPINKLN